MTLQTASDTRPARAAQDCLQEESARYALLRRIAPTLRHHMAGTLQPIGMVSAIMERRLQADDPDLEGLRENGKSIGTLARSASSACMNLITWVAPKENSVVSLRTGVEECVGMLATDLAFRGFTVANKVAASDMATSLISLISLRTVLTASLIALTDSARAPASLVLSSEVVNGQVRVLITVNSDKDATLSDVPRSYRQLGWSDVQVLAAAEQVGLSHDTDCVAMHFSAAEQTDIRVGAF